ncbi:hypothetical protein GCM10009117_02960 [Gangjinia marincola]|uniref:Carboxypeptidase-like regulatory domain-containing protein n=1 Tax=Gangjinia marincola TaxID=578463 RepID=A0ABN1MDN3_9FLAO
MKRLLLFFFIGSISFIAFGQDSIVSAKVRDLKTKKPIAYATIQFGKNSGTITNNEGLFTVDTSRMSNTDSIAISSIGYENYVFAKNKEVDSIIFLVPKVEELDQVFLTSKELDVDEIIDLVEENLEKNFPSVIAKRKMFMRSSSTNHVQEVTFDLQNSTIPEFTKPFFDSLSGMGEGYYYKYEDILGEALLKGERAKIDPIKATSITDENATDISEDLIEELKEIIKKRTKKDSYYKIKMGLIGFTVDNDDFKSDDSSTGDSSQGVKISINEEGSDIYIKDRAIDLKNALKSNFAYAESLLNVIEDNNKYKFIKDGIVSDGEMILYRIKFDSKRRSGFKGELYVNVEDFGVARIVFKNKRKLEGLSLFGFGYKKFLYAGEWVYERSATGYIPSFIRFEEGMTAFVDRNFKIIEKNDNVSGRKRQNKTSVDLTVTTSSTDVHEILFYDNKTITAEAFDAFKVQEVYKPIVLDAYDAQIWSGYSIIEPNRAFKSFRANSGE